MLVATRVYCHTARDDPPEGPDTDPVHKSTTMDVVKSLGEDLSSAELFTAPHSSGWSRSFVLLSRHNHMWYGGRMTSKTLLRMLENIFREAHDLTAEQYRRLIDLYSEAALAGLLADTQKGPHAGGGGANSPNAMLYFLGDTGLDCCDYEIKVREVQTTAFSQGDAFATKHIV